MRMRLFLTVALTGILFGCSGDVPVSPVLEQNPATTPEVMDFLVRTHELALVNLNTHGRRWSRAPDVAELADRYAAAMDLGLEAVYGDLALANSQVEEAGNIIKTWTNIYLSSTISGSRVSSFTDVDIPAAIHHNLSGSTRVGGAMYPINSYQTTSPVLVGSWISAVDLDEVRCATHSAEVTAVTDHSAGWDVRGIGWVPSHERSTDRKICTAQCDGTMPDIGSGDYDPSSPGCSSGPGGNQECELLYVIDYQESYDGGRTWVTVRSVPVYSC